MLQNIWSTCSSAGDNSELHAWMLNSGFKRQHIFQCKLTRAEQMVSHTGQRENLSHSKDRIIRELLAIQCSINFAKTTQFVSCFISFVLCFHTSRLLHLKVEKHNQGNSNHCSRVHNAFNFLLEIISWRPDTTKIYGYQRRVCRYHTSKTCICCCCSNDCNSFLRRATCAWWAIQWSIHGCWRWPPQRNNMDIWIQTVMVWHQNGWRSQHEKTSHQQSPSNRTTHAQILIFCMLSSACLTRCARILLHAHWGSRTLQFLSCEIAFSRSHRTLMMHIASYHNKKRKHGSCNCVCVNWMACRIKTHSSKHTLGVEISIVQRKHWYRMKAVSLPQYEEQKYPYNIKCTPALLLF